jgi:ACS family hexuronate transporter-like MFS transporter
MSSDYSKQPGPIGRYRWVICALLFFATTIIYIDRQILSLLKPDFLDKEFGWTDTQFGAINSAFQVAYGLSMLAFGWFVDKYGTKIGYAVSIAAWAVAAMGHFLIGSISAFFAGRLALGLGEGGNFPAAIKGTAQWFPKRERALATSLFNSGANVGAVVAPAIVPLIAYSMGWRWSYVMVGAAGFVWLLFWWKLFSLPENSKYVSAREQEWIKSDTPDANGGKKEFTWGEVLRHKQAWSFITSKFLTDPVWWFFLIWLPDFFKKTRGLDIKHSWHLLVTIYLIITVLSIFGGWITGHLVQRGWTITRARKTGMFCFALCVLPMASVAWVGNWGAVALIGLAGAAHQAWSANLFTTVSDMFPKSAVAKLTGIGSTAGALVAAIFPILIGYVLDVFKRHDWHHGYTIIFIVFSLAYLLAFAINHLLAPKYEPVKM